MKRARPKNKRAAIKQQKLREKELLQNRDTDSRSNKKSKKVKKRKPLKLLLAFVFAFIILGIFSLGIFDSGELFQPLENGKINVLLMGVDEEGLRTDAIMVASFDTKTEQVKMLSIPRDTKMYVENREMTRKINEIHAISSKKGGGEILGAEATAEAVNALTGIPINYYVEFSFSAIDTVFDALGPVRFDVPDVEGKGRGMNYDDPVQNLHIHLKPGEQELSGNQVQQFLRYRKSNSGAGSGSDTDRVQRQQDFLKEVISQKFPDSIIKLPGILSDVSKLIKTNITVGDITKYTRYLNKFSSENVMTFSLPGENKTISKASYFVCDLEQTKLLISEEFGYDNEIDDSVTLSEKKSQKVLKGGNTGKETKADTSKTKEPEKTKKPTETSSPSKSSVPSKSTQEPTKAPVVTKSPTKAPVVTKEPVATSTPIPLEELE